MSELHLAIVECHYPDEVQDELLKDQYIFGLRVKEIQDHLLGEIVTEDTAEKCLLESCKVGLKIEQRKLLGIKTSMTYNAIYSRVETNQEARVMAEIDPVVMEIKIVDTVVKAIAMGTALHLEKSVKNAAEIIIFKAVSKSNNKHDPSRSRPKKGQKVKTLPTKTEKYFKLSTKYCTKSTNNQI